MHCLSACLGFFSVHHCQLQIYCSDKVMNVLWQDVQMRWNSTYYMVERILEQKKAIIKKMSDHDLPAILTKNHWTLLELLSPFEKVTCHIRSSDASLADVIPVVTALQVTTDPFRQ